MFKTSVLEELVKFESERYSYTPNTGVFIGDVVYANDQNGVRVEFVELLDALRRQVSGILQGKYEKPELVLRPFVLSVCRFKHEAYRRFDEIAALTDGKGISISKSETPFS